MTDEQIKSRFAEAGDFVTRTLRCDGNTLYAYYIDGLTSGGDISEYVFRPISENLSGNLEEAYDAALHGAVYNSAVSVCEDVDEVALKLVNGFCIVLFPGVGALAFEVKTGVKRGPSSPEVENTVKGPKDAFVETIRVNDGKPPMKQRTPLFPIHAPVVRPPAVHRFQHLANGFLRCRKVYHSADGAHIHHILFLRYLLYPGKL